MYPGFGYMPWDPYQLPYPSGYEFDAAAPVGNQWGGAQMSQEQWQALQDVQAAQWNSALAFAMDVAAAPPLPPWNGYDAALLTPFAGIMPSYAAPPGIPAPWDDEASIECSIEYYRRAFEATGTAIEKIEEVCESLGADVQVPAFQTAVDFLQVTIETRDAARAYEQVLNVANTGVVSHATVQPVKAAIRDVAVLRCAAEADPNDKDKYEQKLADAFGLLLDLETDLWSQLKLAYRKQLNCYMSNNQIETAKRGARRPDRRRREQSCERD